MSRSSRELAAILGEGALCAALAVALSKISLFEGPMGGSVDLELAPLIVFAWRRGPILGACLGALGGAASGLVHQFVYSPAQALLDYPLAYACTGLSAVERGDAGRVAGLALACACQLACSVASGVLFFAEYAPPDQGPFVYSLIYNASILVPKYILSGIVAWIFR